MEPQLLDSDQLERESPRDDRLLLVDDVSCFRETTSHRGFIRERIARAQTSIVATHELARVRAVADRVILLHHGRLLPLDRLTGARRVAEPSATEAAVE
jgi:ABC-type Na+ transport system ATPase subunit NatA